MKKWSRHTESYPFFQCRHALKSYHPFSFSFTLDRTTTIFRKFHKLKNSSVYLLVRLSGVVYKITYPRRLLLPDYCTTTILVLVLCTTKSFLCRLASLIIVHTHYCSYSFLFLFSANPQQGYTHSIQSMQKWISTKLKIGPNFSLFCTFWRGQCSVLIVHIHPPVLYHSDTVFLSVLAVLLVTNTLVVHSTFSIWHFRHSPPFWTLCVVC